MSLPRIEIEKSRSNLSGLNNITPKPSVRFGGISSRKDPPSSSASTSRSSGPGSTPSNINRSTSKGFDSELSSPRKKPSSLNTLDEYLNQLGIYDEGNSHWDEFSSLIRSRKSKWIQRFSSTLTEDNIIIPSLSKSEMREIKLKELGWKNIQIPAHSVQPPDLPTNNSLTVAYNRAQGHASYCFYCHQAITIGADFVSCQCCPVSGHVECLPEINKFIPKSVIVEKIRARNKELNPSPRVTFGNPSQLAFAAANKSASTKSSFASDPNETKKIITAHDIEWLCPVCIYDSREEQFHQQITYHQDLDAYHRLINAIKLQAFFRMVYHKNRYNKLRIGMITLQDLFRMRKLALSSEQERSNQRFMFRIKLHDIKLFAHQIPHTAGAQPEFDVIPFPSMMKPHIVGKISSSFYDHLVSGAKEQPQEDVAKSANSNEKRRDSKAGAPPLPHQQPHGYIVSSSNPLNRSILQKNEEMINLLTAPAYSAFDPTTIIYAKSYHESKILPKGSIFVTISVHNNTRPMNPYEDHNQANNSDSLDENQSLDEGSRGISLPNEGVEDPVLAPSSINIANGGISANSTSANNPSQHILNGNLENESITQQSYRVDLLLKENSSNKPLKLRTQQLIKYGYKNIPTPVLEELTKQYSLHSFGPSKSYIMIPYTHANVYIKFTIAQVTEWPKAVVIGQCNYDLRFYLTRHKVLTLYQSIFPIQYHDQIPLPEDANSSTARINFILPNQSIVTRKNPKASVFDSLYQAKLSSHSMENNTLTRTSPLPVVATKSKGEDKTHARDYVHGIVCWSLITIGNSEVNESGFLMIMNQESTSSTQKKYWCILMDKTMYIYNLVVEGVQLKHAYDVRSAYVHLLADEVFRVKFSTDTLYFRCVYSYQFDSWFKKLYTQSQSNSFVSYALYMRRKGNSRSINVSKAYPEGTNLLSSVSMDGPSLVTRTISQDSGVIHRTLSRTLSRTLTRSSINDKSLFKSIIINNQGNVDDDELFSNNSPKGSPNTNESNNPVSPTSPTRHKLTRLSTSRFIMKDYNLEVANMMKEVDTFFDDMKQNYVDFSIVEPNNMENIFSPYSVSLIPSHRRESNVGVGKRKGSSLIEKLASSIVHSRTLF